MSSLLTNSLVTNLKIPVYFINSLIGALENLLGKRVPRVIRELQDKAVILSGPLLNNISQNLMTDEDKCHVIGESTRPLLLLLVQILFSISAQEQVKLCNSPAIYMTSSCL